MRKELFELRCKHEESLNQMIDYFTRTAFISTDPLQTFVNANLSDWISTLEWYRRGVQRSLDKECAKWK